MDGHALGGAAQPLVSRVIATGASAFGDGRGGCSTGNRLPDALRFFDRELEKPRLEVEALMGVKEFIRKELETFNEHIRFQMKAAPKDLMRRFLTRFTKASRATALKHGLVLTVAITTAVEQRYRRVPSNRRCSRVGSFESARIDDDLYRSAFIQNDARPRSADPHGGRVSREQFPDLADRLSRDICDRTLWPDFTKEDLLRA